MRTKTAFLAICIASALGWGSAQAHSSVVTIYSADGLHDGSPNWYQTEFDAFTKATGIKVQYIEAGSAVVVDRLNQEKFNPQADVLVTLPPFMQEAAAEGLLQPFTPAGADHIPAAEKDKRGMFVPMVDDYTDFIYDKAALPRPPKRFKDLLEPKFKNKIQYSTPGEAGDGTAMLLQVFRAFGSKDAGFAYLKALQVNNLGPSSSTGRLTELVNKGELWVANGDIQMNAAQIAQNPNVRVFWPVGPHGKRFAVAIPYYIGLVHGAPHPNAGKKLIDFLLSRQAQAQVSQIAWGFPVRQDVQPKDKNYEQLHSMMRGVAVWVPDWKLVTESFRQDLARYQRETGS